MPSRRTPPRSLVIVALLGGCTGATTTPGWTAAPDVGQPAVEAKVVEVYRSPTCSCCHEWEAYMRRHGWTIRSHELVDMDRVKHEHGLPEATWSCHTAVIDGFVVEGHVPIAAIEHLLATRPSIDGIALPGMPPGSPGMTGVREAAFQVLAIDEGDISPFGAY
jgi:hypothetical protein